MLAGSAIVAVGALTPMAANAAAVVPTTGTTTLTGADTWDIDAGAGAVGANVVYNGPGAVSLTVTSAGGVTSAANLGTVTVTSVAGANTLTVGDGIKAVTLTLNGAVSGDVSANDLNIIVDADNGGGNANSTLVALGNVNLGSGTITLDSDAGGTASFTVNGTAAQTITGVINGAAAGEGVVNVTNTGGTVTFASNIGSGAAIGALNIGGAAGTTSTVNFNGSVILSNASTTGDILIAGTDGADSVVTFKNTVTAAGGDIKLGAAGATVDNNTLNFDASGGNYTVTGAIAGLSANDLNTINVSGSGKTVTFATAMGANIDDINIGAGATLSNSGGGAITASTIDLSTGAELNIVTAATVTGDINGNGTLDIDENTTVVGDIGDVNDLTAIEVATGKVLTIDAATAAEAITVDATTITLQGAGSGITTAQGAQNVTFAENITTAVDGQGAIIVGNTTGSATFQGLGSSTTFSLASFVVTNDAGASTINVNGDMFVDAITLGAADTLNLLKVGSTTVSGTINGTGAAARGLVVVGDAVDATNATFSSAIGGTNAIEGVRVRNLSTANISNNLATKSTAGTNVGVDVDSGGTLNVSTATGAVTISDAVGRVDVDGKVNFTGANNATLSATTDVFVDGTDAITTALGSVAGKTLSLTAGAGSDVVLGGDTDTTISLGNQLVLNAGDDILVSDASDRTVTLKVNYRSVFDPDATTVIDDTATTGSFVVDTTGTRAALNVTLDANTFELDNGDTITVIDTDDLEDETNTDTTWTALITSGDVVLQDTGLVDIQANGALTDDLLIKAVFKQADDVFEGGSSGVGAAQELMDIASTATTGELETARGNLLGAATADDAQAIGESLASTTDGGNVLATMNFVSRTADFNTVRLAALRDGTAETGMAAGSAGSGVGWWGQVFGTTGDQSNRDGVDGFEFDTIGVAAGVDTQNVAENATVGVALSYAKTDVESDNSNATETDINSFQIALYGDYDLDDRTYVAGQVGYVWGNNDTKRFNVGGISGLTADGDYDSNQFNVRGEVGRDYMSNGAKVTPKLLADYTYYNADSYTETGAGTANLEVDQDSLNAFNVGVGVDATWQNKNANGSVLEPGVHAAVRYDLVGDDISATNTFTGAGDAFQTDGLEPGRLTFDAGAGVTYHATTNWSVKAEYNFQGKEDFHSHSALVRAGYKF